MILVESVDTSGTTMKQSFSFELTGFGRCRSGMNMGSGTIWMKRDGKAFSEWSCMMMTADKEMIVWSASGHCKQMGEELKGIVIATFMTKSEKYAWMNSAIAVLDITGGMMDFSDVAYASE